MRSARARSCWPTSPVTVASAVATARSILAALSRRAQIRAANCRCRWAEMGLHRYHTDFAHVLDLEAYRQLCMAYGGTVVHVKKCYRDDDELVKLIGRDAADRLSREFGGDRITPSLKEGRRAKLARLRQQDPDITARELALKLGISERHVYELLNPPGDTRQSQFSF